MISRRFFLTGISALAVAAFHKPVSNQKMHVLSWYEKTAPDGKWMRAWKYVPADDPFKIDFIGNFDESAKYFQLERASPATYFEEVQHTNLIPRSEV